MSGIVGVLNLNGEQVREEQLYMFTRSLAIGAPDEQNIWLGNNIGFGHSLLKIGGDTQVHTGNLDSKFWITADARIDNRKELIRELKAGSDKFTSPTAASDLILHSYKIWGENCVEHIIGDFVFAIWDEGKQQLFCARDQLGVKQFYYSNKQEQFIFSNSLNCLRLHPGVTNDLNETAIGDFLLFGLNQDPSSTTFKDIQRLPPAHCLTISKAGIRIRKYWTLSADSISYKKEDEYIERFSELLNEAVIDRLPESEVGIFLSGGLDSSAVAAHASAAQAARPGLKLSAVCVVYDQVFEDEERRYAQLVADSLKIPIEFLEGNEINEGDSSRSLGYAPEPFNVDPIYVVSDKLLSTIAKQNRVALTGWDGDAFFNESPRHLFSWLLKKGRLVKLASSLLQYVVHEHSPPPLGIRTAIRQLRHPDWNSHPFPVWLNPEFTNELNLLERWQYVNAQTAQLHPVRPRAFATLDLPHWSALLGGFDPAVTQLSLEVRHPLIDVRVLEYVLTLPVIPWLLNKRILRRSMKGRLPERILSRPKTPLMGDPGLQLRYSTKLKVVDEFDPVPTLNSYVNRPAIPAVSQASDGNQLWINVRPFSLNQWLKNSY